MPTERDPDEKLGSLHKSDLVIGRKTSMGKTALATNIATTLLKTF